MPRPKSDPKADTLREQGCLHPHPEQVTDEVFGASAFFDRRDLVQVKYEMLRRVRVDGQSVSQSAAGFGLSRPSYYQALAALRRHLPALLPKKPGPRRAHKLSEEVMTALLEALAEEPQLGPRELVELAEARFGLSVHRRSIERALARQEKNGDERRPTQPPTHTTRRSDDAQRYEVLRAQAVACQALASRDGLVVLLRQGVAAWMAAWSRLPAPWIPSAPPVQTARQPSSPSPLSDETSPEVVRILAAMTLSHLREVPA